MDLHSRGVRSHDNLQPQATLDHDRLGSATVGRWNLTSNSNRLWFHGALLGLWMVVGSVLRFTNLTLKPLWTDEFSTIVFSLGNSFLTIPTDQVISLNQLLEPMRPIAGATVGSVVHNLLSESNHPPLYFVLTHLWLKLFPTVDGYVSIWGVRSLSALFGVMAIPACFWLAWVAFRNLTISHLSAYFMAASPFGIYLAQEARHYTLAVLWIIASIGCLIIAVRALVNQKPLPVRVMLAWVVINGLGIATHYFFILTLLSETAVLLYLLLRQLQHSTFVWHALSWGRVGIAMGGTIATGLVWIPFLYGIQDSKLTEWLYRDGSGLAFLNPILESLAGWSTMLYMLPIQAPETWIVQASAIATILVCFWIIPKFQRGLQQVSSDPIRRLSIQVLGTFVLSAIAIFLGITYFLGMDLPSTFRYNFVYFPGIILLLGAGLSVGWSTQNSQKQDRSRLKRFLFGSSRLTVIAIAILGLLGSVVVVTNLGYQKPNRPDTVAESIWEDPSDRVLLAIAHTTHGQTGRMMGVAWDLKNHPDFPKKLRKQPKFLLSHDVEGTYSGLDTLKRILSKPRRTTTLWLLNFPPPVGVDRRDLLTDQKCRTRSELYGVDGYRYQQYKCFRTKPRNQSTNA